MLWYTIHAEFLQSQDCVWNVIDCVQEAPGIKAFSTISTAIIFRQTQHKPSCYISMQNMVICAARIIQTNKTYLEFTK